MGTVGALLIFFAGLGTDVGTTAYGAQHGLTEANPIIAWAGPRGSAPLVAGLGIGGVIGLYVLLHKHHPKLLVGILVSAGLGHSAAAFYNVHQFHKATFAEMVAPNLHVGMRLGPDGSWYNPDYATVDPAFPLQ